MKEEVLQLIFDVIDEMNDSLPSDQQVAKDPERILFGKEGQLDSLGLVELVVAVGDEVEDRFDQTIVLADEKAISQENSPFRTINVLADYVVGLIEGNSGD